MSHSTALENKNRRQPEVNFRQYLESLREPQDVASRDTPNELEAELLKNTYLMRRQVKRIAHRMRGQYL